MTSPSSAKKITPFLLGALLLAGTSLVRANEDPARQAHDELVKAESVTGDVQQHDLKAALEIVKHLPVGEKLTRKEAVGNILAALSESQQGGSSHDVTLHIRNAESLVDRIGG